MSRSLTEARRMLAKEKLLGDLSYSAVKAMNAARSIREAAYLWTEEDWKDFRETVEGFRKRVIARQFPD